MTIRPTITADFEAIAAITNHYIRETAIHFNYEPVAASDLRGSWEARRDRYPHLTLDLDSGVGGFAKSGPWRDRDAYRFTAEVSVYLRPDVTRRGLGKVLYAALIDACRATGFHSLIGGIALPNDGSIALHERLGFVRTADFRQVGWKFNRWHDVAFFQLLL